MDINAFQFHGPLCSGSPSAGSTPIPRHSSGELFLKGPIPLNWLCTAATVPGAASLKIAVALWYLVGLQKTNGVKLTGRTLKMFKVHPGTASRALRRLEEAELVHVDRGPGRCPVVTLLQIGRSQEPE